MNTFIWSHFSLYQTFTFPLFSDLENRFSSFFQFPMSKNKIDDVAVVHVYDFKSIWAWWGENKMVKK